MDGGKSGGEKNIYINIYYIYGGEGTGNPNNGAKKTFGCQGQEGRSGFSRRECLKIHVTIENPHLLTVTMLEGGANASSFFSSFTHE